jgi:hypothetical protein
LAFAAPVNITADEDVVLVVVIDEALADVVIELPGVTDHVDDELVITAATGVVEVVCWDHCDHWPLFDEANTIGALNVVDWVHSDQTDEEEGTTTGATSVDDAFHSDQDETSEDTGNTGMVDVGDCVHSDQDDSFEVVTGTGGIVELVHSAHADDFEVVTGATETVELVHSAQEDDFEVMTGVTGMVEPDEDHTAHEDSWEVVIGAGELVELDDHSAHEDDFEVVIGAGGVIELDDDQSTQTDEEIWITEVVKGRDWSFALDVVITATGGVVAEDHSPQLCPATVGCSLQLPHPSEELPEPCSPPGAPYAAGAADVRDKLPAMAKSTRECMIL